MGRWTRIGLLVAMSAGLTAGGAGTALTQSLLAAHRGGAGLRAENSLGAFRNALALGVDFLEFDVHRTRDGHLVVIHDPSLERTTTGIGQVRHLTLADLRGVRLKGPDSHPIGEPVPTLDEVLALAAPTTVGLLLEIKTGPRRERYDGIEEAVLARLRAHGLDGRTIIMSFHPGVVQRVRDLAPALRTSLLVSRRTLDRQGATVEEAVRWAASLGATHVGLEHALITPAALGAARQRGLGVGAWTVNDERDMRRMIDLGVDILITDRPDLARPLLGR